MAWFFVALAFMFGASWASFFGVVIERGRTGESINGRSHCVCGRQLKWYENVPVFGWLKTLGKTKCCNQQIPVWYFFSELITGLVFAAIAFYILKDMM